MTDRLDQLLESCRSNKPAAKAQQEFQDAWLQLARAGGFTELARDYLLAGSKFRSGDSFAVLWEESSDKQHMISLLTDCAAPASPKPQQLGLLLRILGRLLNTGAPVPQLRMLIAAAMRLAQTPQGGYLQHAEVKVRDEFLSLINSGTELPDFRILLADDKDRQTFVDFFAAVTARTTGKAWSAAKLNARRRLLDWMEAATPVPKQTAAPSPAAALPGSESDSVQKLTTAISLLQEMIPYLEALEKRRQASTEPKEQSQPEASQSSALIAHLEEELAAKTELIEVIQRDHHAAAVGRTEALEEALAHEYDDFCGAESLPMSDMLGENLRDQLRKVFDLLRQHGIHF